jgi:hypothetical protein
MVLAGYLRMSEQRMMNEQMEFTSDVFISYSPIDQQWVDDQLLKRLEGAGISYVEEHTFEPGTLKLQAIEDAIVRSRRTLLVITSNYLKNAWQQYENIAALGFMLQDNTSKTRVIPAIRETCDMPLRLKALVPVDLCADDEKQWTRLLKALGSRAMPVPVAGDGCAPQSPAPAPAVNEYGAADSLTVLLKLMNRVEVREPVSMFQADFEALREQMKALESYKKLHELLQKLEDQYNEIYHHGLSAGMSNPEWEVIELVEYEVQDIIASLITTARKLSFATDDDVWVQKLNRVTENLPLAIKNSEAAKLKSVMRRLFEVLDSVPSKLNAQMVETAKALRLTPLVEALTVVHDTLSKLDPKGVTLRHIEAINNGVVKIEEMDLRLRSMIFVHDSLQAVDAELRRIESSLDEDIQSQIVDAWHDLKPKMQIICMNNIFEWAAKLSASSTNMDGLASIQDQAKVLRTFRAFRSLISRSFNQVDEDMISHCSALEDEVGKPLAPLLLLLQEH